MHTSRPLATPILAPIANFYHNYNNLLGVLEQGLDKSVFLMNYIVRECNLNLAFLLREVILRIPILEKSQAFQAQFIFSALFFNLAKFSLEENLLYSCLEFLIFLLPLNKFEKYN